MADVDAKCNYSCITLKFEKALTLEPPSLVPEEERLTWLCFGYFDILHVYPLMASGEEQNQVKCIYNEINQKLQNVPSKMYSHPLHIMTNLDEKGKAEKYCKFFEEDSFPFSCVTFLQCPATVQKAPQALEKEVNELLSQSVESVTKDSKYCLSFVVYQTLNLSDFVVLWHSNSLPLLLSALRTLHTSSLVGDLHSIPSVRIDQITALNGEGTKPAKCYDETPIDQVFTRYIIRDSGLASQYFCALPDNLAETPFFSTGVEDVSSVLTEVPTSMLLERMFYRLYDKDGSSAFCKAFLDCETHLGIKGYNSPSTLQEGSQLYNLCERLNSHFAIVQKHIYSLTDDGLDNDWLRTAGNLYHALVDMSRNAVADGFCYLVIDSAALFCDELNKIDIPCSNEELMMFQRFIRGWGSLIDQTMRLDGKFAQQPGYSPALCPIPSRLLEFYLAFTKQCVKMMQFNSSDNSRFSLLLVPKLCRRIKVESVFYQCPPTDRLLFVDIPFDVLFDPFFALGHLCHEISHFCGESWRLREYRKKIYLKICARELAIQLDIENDSVINSIYEALSFFYYSAPAYLDSLREEIINHLSTLIYDSSYITQWIEQAYPKNSYNHEAYARNIGCIQKRNALINSIGINSGKPINHLYAVIQTEYYNLFRECYADISNIFTLRLNPAEYVNLLQKEIVLLKRGQREEDEYALTVIRWTVVLYVTNKGPLRWYQMADIHQNMDRFVKDIEAYYQYFFNNGSAPLMYCLDRTCIGYLCDYLSRCLNTMKSVEEHRESDQYQCLQRIRTVFRQMTSSSGIMSEESWQIISDYRSETLQNMGFSGTL